MNWKHLSRLCRARLSRSYWTGRKGVFECLHRAEEHPFRDQKLEGLPHEVAASFRSYGAYKQEEYVGRTQTKASIEPEIGYVFAGTRRLIAESVPYSGIDHVPDVAR